MSTTNFSFSNSQIATLVHSGEDYFYRLEKIILESKSEIHIQTYILDFDKTGKRIIEALKKAAAKNVKIHILLDGFGSFSFPEKEIENLNKIGIDIRLFSSFFSTNSLYIGRRLHHKLVVADSKIALDRKSVV